MPADRFATAAEFARALGRARGHDAPADAAAAPSRAPPAPTPATAPPRSAPAAGARARRSPCARLGFLLGLGVLFGWLRRHGAPPGGRRRRQAPRRAPVREPGRLGDDEYFADGVTDEVRGKLAALPGLQVIAAQQLEPVQAERPRSPQQIAPRAGRRLSPRRQVRWEKGAGGTSRVRGEPRAGAGRAGRPPTTVAAAVRRLAHRRVPGAGGHRGPGGPGARRGARHRTQQQLAEQADREPRGLRRVPEGRARGHGAGRPGPDCARRSDYYEQAVALDSAFALGLGQARRRGVAALRPRARRPRLTPSAPALRREPGAGARAEPPRGRQWHWATTTAGSSGDQRPGADGVRRGVTSDSTERRRAARGSGARGGGLGRWEEASEHYRAGRHAGPPLSADGHGASPPRCSCLRRYPEALRRSTRAPSRSAPPTSVPLQDQVMTTSPQGDLDRRPQSARSARRRSRARPPWWPTSPRLWDLYWVLDEGQQQLVLRLPPSAFDDDRGAWAMRPGGDLRRAGRLAPGPGLRGLGPGRVRGAAAATPRRRAAPRPAGIALAYSGRKAEAVREGQRRGAASDLQGRATSGAYAPAPARPDLHRWSGEQEKALDRLEPLLEMPYYCRPAGSGSIRRSTRCGRTRGSGR